MNCNASTLQSLTQLHGEWKLSVRSFFFPLVSFFCSFRRLAVSRMFRDTMILRVWPGMTRDGTPHRTGRFLKGERERRRETRAVARSIKICACATSLLQARSTLFLTAIKETRPSPPTLVSSFFVAIAGKGLDQNYLKLWSVRLLLRDIRASSCFAFFSFPRLISPAGFTGFILRQTRIGELGAWIIYSGIGRSCY